MTNVESVAKFILQDVGDMSTMKLQKLCYLAQGYHLAWTGRPLFEQDFQAWKYGPVCPRLFRLHRGMFNIDAEQLEQQALSVIPELSDEEKGYVHAAVAPFTELSGIQLGDLTHEQDPWKNARNNAPEDSPSRSIISKKAMRSFYSKQLVGA